MSIGGGEAPAAHSLLHDATGQTKLYEHFTVKELIARFEALDSDESGRIEMCEYLRFALRDALRRSATRCLDLFHQWDTDGSGSLELAELNKILRRGGEIQLDAKLKAGGAGAIETKAKTKIKIIFKTK